MRTDMRELSIGDRHAAALFASGMQRGDEPSAGQVRHAIASAVQELGHAGCAGRVAQEFGDHPETAAPRMRWARAAASEAYAAAPAGPGSRPDAGALPARRPQPRGRQASHPMALTALLLGVLARQPLGSPLAARPAVPHARALGEPARLARTVPVFAGHGPQPSRESLTLSEARVLRYLPTHLSAREIAAELYLSMNTVKTHQRHLYAKLGAHSRAQAVEQARALGLLTLPARGSRHE